MKSYLITFLRWSEKYTKTDMVYLAHGGFWLGLAQLIASIGSFALTLVLANLLTPEVFGEYRFLMSAFLILVIFALPGMQTALMESTPKGFKRNIVVAFRESMRFGLIGSAFSLLAALYYFTKDNLSLSLGFTVIALALPFFNATSMYLFFLKALKKFESVTVYTLITRSVLLIASVIAALLFPQYAWVILAAFLLGQIIPNALFHKRTVSEYVDEEGMADPTLPSYAKHLTVMAALGLLAVQLDKILVWNMVGAEELAIFFIAYAIPQEMNRFLRLPPMLAFPKFTTTSPEVIRQTLLPKIWRYFLLISALVLVYIVLAPYIFTILFPQYTEAIIYSQALVPSVLAAAFAPILTFLITIKEKKSLYILSSYLPAIRIIVAVSSIPFLGIWGAVYAILIEATARIFFSLYFFSKKY